MNKQATAWAGEFGDQYAKRSPGNVAANKVLFERILRRRLEGGAQCSIVELGAGVGSNLIALRELLPRATLAAVEINPMAMHQLIASGAANEMYQESILEWTPPKAYDLAFTKGVLIHIPPEDLPRAYDLLYRSSAHYVLIAEYYAPRPAEIEYRGRRNMLWKRDFAGEMLDACADLHLIDYGFVYHRDPYPQDDLNWWLMEKRP